jgi:hypothetical protein
MHAKISTLPWLRIMLWNQRIDCCPNVPKDMMSTSSVGTGISDKEFIKQGKAKRKRQA